MVWRLVLACLAVAALSRGAAANGRLPSTSSIVFRQGNDNEIAVGLTFGLMISHDAGTTWTWLCEDAVGYSGEYDPRYAFSTTGALFATTHDSLRVVRDSCTFNPATATMTFASIDALAVDNTLYYAASEAPDAGRGIAGDYKIYRSIDDGAQFEPTAGQPDGPISWWQSLEVAPSNPQVLYLAGYVFLPDPGGGTRKEQRLFRSDNGGTSWLPLPLAPDTVTVAPNSLIDIVGIANEDPDHLYMRVTYDDNRVNHSIYRSTDKGVSWHRITRKPMKLDAFIVRAAKNSDGKHDLIVGGANFDAEISHDDGDTWTVLPGPPHGRCLVENSAGELWACAENYGSNGIAKDGAGIMKTRDPEHDSWTKVLHYQDLTDAASCAAGTKQAACAATMWCAVCAQLGCTPSLAYSCAAMEAPPTPIETPPHKSGCCDGGSGAAGALALGLPVGMMVLRRRRRGI